jgi:hypothetical protein
VRTRWVAGAQELRLKFGTRGKNSIGLEESERRRSDELIPRSPYALLLLDSCRDDFSHGTRGCGHLSPRPEWRKTLKSEEISSD